jgi:hypothetical protein
LFDTSAEYREALDRLESRPEYARKLGKRARAKAAADYSLDEVARRYIALYRETAPIRPGPIRPEPPVLRRGSNARQAAAKRVRFQARGLGDATRRNRPSG